MSTNEKAPAHTPVPWRTDWLGDDRGWILDEQSNYLAEIVTEDDCGFVVPKNEQRANAEFIVRACNSHTELLARLKLLHERVSMSDMTTAEEDEGTERIIANANGNAA